MQSKAYLWTGRALTLLSAAFLFVDAGMKVARASVAVNGTIQAGFPDSTVAGIGMALLLSTLLYVVPRTAVLGAILVTGYLGGAVAANVRLGNPLFGFVLFPVYMGILIWGGLYLRDERIRQLIPLRSNL